MADWETVRELGFGFPEVEEQVTRSRPSLRVRGKLFAWMSPHEEGAFVVRVDPDEKHLLLDSRPDLYFTTPHYANYAGILIRLDRIERAELAERIEDSWLLAAPKRLAAKFIAESS